MSYVLLDDLLLLMESLPVHSDVLIFCYYIFTYAGMAYIGGLLLMSMEEEDTFWALVSLFDRPKYLSGYYDPSMGK